MPDTVTLVLDAEQYNREIAKLTSQNERFKKSGDRVGDSLDGIRLKTEGRVANNIGAIARSFSSGGSAADIFSEAVTRLSESFRGSLLFAGAAAAGIGIAEAITKPLEAIIKLKSEIANLTRSSGTSDFLGSDQINANLTDIGNKLNEINARQIERAHPGTFSFLNPFRAREEAADQEAANALKVKAGDDINALSEKTDRLNKVEKDRAAGLKTTATLEENQINRLERLGAIARTAVLAGADGRPALNAANQHFDQIALDLLRQAALAGNIPSSGIGAFKKSLGDQLVRPFNTGPLLEQSAQDAERLSQAQAKQGDFVESARLHQIALSRHEQSTNIQAGRGLQALDGLQFNGLITVDKLKFEGLKILNGLSISIQ